MSALEVGATGTARMTVDEADTAQALGSGDLRVLGTPRVAALAEAAAVGAIAGGLDDARSSVGTRLELDHLAPTPVGATVEALARVTAIDGRRVDFAIDVTSGELVVARARHARAVVDRERFLAHPALAGG